VEFWVVILPLIAVPSFTITGILFHQIFLADAKLVTLFHWSKYYAFYAITAIIGAFLSGFLIDWVSARKSSFIGHSALLIGLICLWLGQANLALILFFSFFGLASGMITSNTNALLAEKYGTKWLGEIRAATQPVTVASSAISPILLGVMIDKGFGLTGLMLVLIIISAYPVIAAIVNFNVLVRE
jgi:MFS family permease